MVQFRVEDIVAWHRLTEYSGSIATVTRIPYIYICGQSEDFTWRVTTVAILGTVEIGIGVRNLFIHNCFTRLCVRQRSRAQVLGAEQNDKSNRVNRSPAQLWLISVQFSEFIFRATK